MKLRSRPYNRGIHFKIKSEDNKTEGYNRNPQQETIKVPGTGKQKVATRGPSTNSSACVKRKKSTGRNASGQESKATRTNCSLA